MATIAFLFAIWQYKYRSVATAKADLAEIKERTISFRQLAERNTKQQLELYNLRKRQQLFDRLGASFDPIKLLGVLSDKARPLNGEITILEMDFAPFIIQRKVEKKSAAAPVRRRRGLRAAPPKSRQQEFKSITRTELSLKGHAIDDLVLSSFITSLRQTGVFHSVELKSSDDTNQDPRFKRAYHVRCVF